MDQEYEQLQDQTEDTHGVQQVFISDETEDIESGKIPVLQQLALLSVLLFLLLGGVITPRIIAFFQEETEAIPAAVPAHIETKVLPSTLEQGSSATEAFSNIDIQAEAAFVWDVQNQKALYRKNEQEALPLASVAKLMTALVAHELLSEQSGVTIGDEAMRQYGNSGLYTGETFDRLLLSDLVLMSSSNDGAYALAAAAGEQLSQENAPAAFVQAMNVRADELGLHDTSFKNPTGLDTSQTASGAEGSAKDVTFLMEYILTHEPDILAYTTEDNARIYSNDGLYHDTENTNYYVSQIPGLIGSKTGYTDLAGGNLVVAFDAGLNRPFVVTVLGSTRQERFTDVLNLVEATQQYVANN